MTDQLGSTMNHLDDSPTTDGQRSREPLAYGVTHLGECSPLVTFNQLASLSGYGLQGAYG